MFRTPSSTSISFFLSQGLVVVYKYS
jgi:hypothetical protein